jgi:hypothetical protein
MLNRRLTRKLTGLERVGLHFRPYRVPTTRDGADEHAPSTTASGTTLTTTFLPPNRTPRIVGGDPGVEFVLLQAAHGEVPTRNHAGAVTFGVGNADVLHLVPLPSHTTNHPVRPARAWMFTGSFISSTSAAPVCR